MKMPAAMKDTAASNFGKRTFPLLERQTSTGPGSGALNNSAYPQSKVIHQLSGEAKVGSRVTRNAFESAKGGDGHMIDRLQLPGFIRRGTGFTNDEEGVAAAAALVDASIASSASRREDHHAEDDVGPVEVKRDVARDYQAFMS